LIWYRIIFSVLIDNKLCFNITYTVWWKQNVTLYISLILPLSYNVSTLNFCNIYIIQYNTIHNSLKYLKSSQSGYREISEIIINCHCILRTHNSLKYLQHNYCLFRYCTDIIPIEISIIPLQIIAIVLLLVIIYPIIQSD